MGMKSKNAEDERITQIWNESCYISTFIWCPDVISVDADGVYTSHSRLA